MSIMPKIITLAGVVLLTGCGALKAVRLEPSANVIANCPKLQPLTDDSFGATAQALVETSIQYRKCREAALASTKTDGRPLSRE